MERRYGGDIAVHPKKQERKRTGRFVASSLEMALWGLFRYYIPELIIVGKRAFLYGIFAGFKGEKGLRL
jgi:hypothetical protein